MILQQKITLNKTKNLKIQNELKAEQDKVILVDFFIGYFLSFIFNNKSQNLLIFQPILKFFTMLTCMTETISV